MARASLEELRLDYEDFLRQRGLVMWERNDPRRKELIALRPATAQDVAAWAKKTHDSGRGGPSGRDGQDGQKKKSTKSMMSMSSSYSEIAANGALALLAVATTLLDRQLAAQAEAFETEGGFTERLYRVRQQSRQKR